MNPLHHTLKSGRVLLLSEPFTDAEKEAAETTMGNMMLELMADGIARIAHAKTTLSEQDAEYIATLERHGITFTQ